MMLVYTAVWIDHLRRVDPILVGMLEQVRVAVHPFARAVAARRARARAATRAGERAVIGITTVFTFSHLARAAALDGRG